MRANKTRDAAYTRVACIPLLLVALAAGAAVAASSKPRHGEPERIFVTAVAGDVAVTMGGTPTSVAPESTVSLPARIVTGDDGTIGLAQAGTKITVAANSDIEIPPEAAEGQLIARLVQHRGNAFYDVAHREAGTLRVETPFLVAVIKGTQFNVAVQEDSTTISLFQGRLELRIPDASDVIHLDAGQIAIRGPVDRSIRMLGMNDPRVQNPRAAERGVAAAERAEQAVALPAPRVASVAVAADGTRVDTDAPEATAGTGAGAGANLGVSGVGVGVGHESGADYSDHVGLGVGHGSGADNSDHIGPGVGHGSGAGNSDHVGLRVGHGWGAGNSDHVGLRVGHGWGAGNSDHVGVALGATASLSATIDPSATVTHPIHPTHPTHPTHPPTPGGQPPGKP